MVRVSIPGRRAESTETTRAKATERAAGRPSRVRRLGDALAGAAVGGLVYLAVRRRLAGASPPALEEVRDAVDEVASGAQRAVPTDRFGGADADAGAGDESIGDVQMDTASTDRSDEEIRERVSDDVQSSDTASTDRSDEEIRERASDDVQSEPAEPGEMTVDEAVADTLVDEGGPEDSGA